MTYPYRIRSPEIWAQARDDYLAGLDAETVCRRYELGLSAFRARARKYGWRRRDQPGATPDVQDLAIYDDLSIYEEVETAGCASSRRWSAAGRWRPSAGAACGRR